LPFPASTHHKTFLKIAPIKKNKKIPILFTKYEELQYASNGPIPI
jgi:hypothetical protein